MRIHRLAATAFGPFADEISVDFDDVCSAGLFLVHGATGAGKTSLLDAICFALFADLPGARSKKGLGSDHAASGARPVVELEFSVAARRFRIERSAEFSRPKKRGSGVLTVPAKVVLEEWDGEKFMGVTTRHDEAADLLDQVLGMGLTQFAKVVVLPQGDVSAFLRATAEDRRILLERLFDISTFTGVEAWLADERRRTTAEVEAHRSLIHREFARLDDLLSVEDAPDFASLPTAHVQDALDRHTEALEQDVLEHLAAADAAVLRLDQANADLHEAQRVTALQQRGREATGRRAAALEAADAIARVRTRVQRARAAEAITGHLEALDRAEQELKDTAGAVSASLGALPPHLTSALGSHTDLETESISTLLARMTDADPLLAELGHTQQALKGLSKKLNRAQQTLAASHEVARVAEAYLTAAQAAISTAVTQCAELEPIAADHQAASALLDRAKRLHRLGTSVADLRQSLAETTPSLLAAREVTLAAQQTLIDLRQRRLEGMAGELASALVEGDSCPVCGSLDHPTPAASSDVVTSADLDIAEAAHSTAITELSAVEGTYAATQSKIDTYVAELLAEGCAVTHEDPPDVDSLQDDVDQAEARLTRAQTAVQQLATAQEAQRAARETAEDAAQRANKAFSDVAAAESAIATLVTEQDELITRARDRAAQHAKCPCQGSPMVDDPAELETDALAETMADIAQFLEVHQSVARRLAHLSRASARRDECVARVSDVQALSHAAAIEHGFPSLVDVRHAILPGRTVRDYEDEIRAHHDVLAITAEILADPDVTEALDHPQIDLDAVSAHQRASQVAAMTARSHHTAAEQRLHVLRSVRTTLGTHISELHALTERASAVKELADAANGTGTSNLLKMRLSSFVLAARLEKVVALANERLQQMDSGRYLLEHSDARAGRGRSGLGLHVLDQWTGRSRETSTLSGGESFMVSLALALGLADTVREESGGFDLGTLFIDEGFGSLDEDSLEHVLGVLDGLREGGRAVGVVSHVPELRSRITHQIVVKKTTSGSHVEVETRPSPAA